MAERRVLTRRSVVGARGFALLCVLTLICGFRSGVLALLMAAAAAAWQPPAAKEGQGDCDFRLRTVRLRAQCSVRLHGSRTPVALRATYAGPPWILLYPLKRRRSAEGLEAAGRGILTRRSALLQRVIGVALCSAAALRFLRRRSCAAFGCGSSLVAASGGQGGLGGLRFPPKSSLDSPVTP